MPGQPAQPAAPPPIQTPSDAEVARYVAEMCVELKQITARRPAFRTVSYLLDMARLESEQVVKGRPAR